MWLVLTGLITRFGADAYLLAWFLRVLYLLSWLLTLGLMPTLLLIYFVAYAYVLTYLLTYFGACAYLLSYLLWCLCLLTCLLTLGLMLTYLLTYFVAYAYFTVQEEVEPPEALNRELDERIFNFSQEYYLRAAGMANLSAWLAAGWALFFHFWVFFMVAAGEINLLLRLVSAWERIQFFGILTREVSPCYRWKFEEYLFMTSPFDCKNSSASSQIARWNLCSEMSCRSFESRYLRRCSCMSGVCACAYAYGCSSWLRACRMLHPVCMRWQFEEHSGVYLLSWQVGETLLERQHYASALLMFVELHQQLEELGGVWNHSPKALREKGSQHNASALLIYLCISAMQGTSPAASFLVMPVCSRRCFTGHAMEDYDIFLEKHEYDSAREAARRARVNFLKAQLPVIASESTFDCLPSCKSIVRISALVTDPISMSSSATHKWHVSRFSFNCDNFPSQCH